MVVSHIRVQLLLYCSNCAIQNSTSRIESVCRNVLSFQFAGGMKLAVFAISGAPFWTAQWQLFNSGHF
jgi:hypothetical protein